MAADNMFTTSNQLEQDLASRNINFVCKIIQVMGGLLVHPTSNWNNVGRNPGNTRTEHKILLKHNWYATDMLE